MAQERRRELALQRKSLSRLRLLQERLDGIDSRRFPTESSESARDLVLSLLDRISQDRELIEAIDAEVLFNRISSLEPLVRGVEQSDINKISWPLVNFWGSVWREMFPKGQKRLFFSVTGTRNYSIQPFSNKVKAGLQGVIPEATDPEWPEPESLYAIHLAGLEEGNLPLYANIGHEFGHALYDEVWDTELVPIWAEEVGECRELLAQAIEEDDPQKAPQRNKKLDAILRSLTRELFADLVGALLVGPSSALALDEFLWGKDPGTWHVRLAPKSSDISAYPSLAYRTALMLDWSDFESFQRDLSSHLSEHLRGFADELLELPIADHEDDQVRVQPDSDPDSTLLTEILQENLDSVKKGFQSYLGRCGEVIEERCGESFAAVDPEEVAKLMERFGQDLLPNIIPDGSLLGTRAHFRAIVNAAALYRLYFLTNEGEESAGLDADQVAFELDKIQRLTDKALEVSYVQKRHDDWLKQEQEAD